MFGWRVPRADEALLISGGKRTGQDTAFRVVVGHGAFVIPGIRKAGFLSLDVTEATIQEECITQQGIALRVQGVVVFKVGDDVASIANAARRFLDREDQMNPLVGQVFGGHLRSVVGGLTVEDIIRNRGALAQEVRDSTSTEMERMGLVIDSFQVKEIEDPSNYIQALAAPHVAEVQKEARIAQAKADQAASQQEQDSAAQKAGYERDSQIAQAQAAAATQQAQATAAQAGPLAQAKAQQAVIEEQTKVAQLEADRKAAELVGTVQKTADADAYRVRVAAEADAKASEVRAKALEGGNLERIIATKLVDVLPAIVQQVANGVSGSNVTIFNGAEGLTDFATKIVSQGMSVYKTALAGLNAASSEGDEPVQ